MLHPMAFVSKTLRIAKVLVLLTLLAFFGQTYNANFCQGSVLQLRKSRYMQQLRQPLLAGMSHNFRGDLAGTARAPTHFARSSYRGFALGVMALMALTCPRGRRERLRASWIQVIRGCSAATLDYIPSNGEKNKETSEFVTPAVWNTPLFRAVAVVSGGALAGGVLPFSAMLHLASFAIWMGTNVWTTFVAGITMFKALPRQQFGTLQAKLFPKYFQIGATCTAIMIFTGLRMELPVGAAVVSLLGTLANMLYLEPKATSVMFERYKRENDGLKDAETDKKLKSKFSKLHGMSSLANLVALVGLVAHGVHLASRMAP
eukprot:TRINITY_DN66196_c0_g1_i1.p1 TRINITY_DN66196_c0_g1~~TRINITY_DN66196_c0_g1_i1.p1  ORF type:complete len:317 (+),score=53.15 TRINITY_DN66196_c0_g1_i1:24-974(+)